ncbi:MAG: response regulator transcription factor [Lachnospiraceae bacterium]|nr:response regulator transcription factor [Lachnospiraceae bacterium]
MIYLVEDEKNIRDLVVYTLNSAGLETSGFEQASDFWKAVENSVPSLLLLDIMLPDEDGLSVLKKIRSDKKLKKIPVILLTAKGSEYDKVIGLDAGADDYISKPFGMMELIARVKAMLRRTVPEQMDTDYEIGNLYVSPSRHIVKVDGKEVALTYKEFELLNYFLDNMDMVLTRDKILSKIWGYNFDGETRTVDVHVRTLRQKLGSAGDIIETIRGVGYKISRK